MFTERELNFHKATIMVLSDRPEEPVDAILFHMRSFGDDTNLFETAQRFIKKNHAELIVVSNNEGERVGSNVPREANPGKTEYFRRLEEIGVPSYRICIPIRRIFHTRQENTAFIEEAKRQNWTRVAILIQPHQALRALLGAVQAQSELKYPLEIFTIAPSSTDWKISVKGSQGREEKPREEHIFDEFSNIIKYQETGELATFEELFAYWHQRGSLKLKRDLPPELQGGFLLG